MAHTPHNWTTGETIAAATLNAIEQDLAAAAVKADSDAAYDAKGAATAAQAAAVQRANHTGTQSADTLTDGTTNKAYTAAEKTKLAGVATGATANVVGAAGSGAGNALSANDPTTTNSRTPTAHTHPASDLTATGTRDGTTFLRGDNTWATPAGGSGGAGLPATVVNRTTAYTAAAGDFVQADVSSAGFTVTLPAAPAVGALVAVKKVDATANTLTIAPSGGGSIDGDPTATTTTKMAGAIFEHVGTNVWRIVASMTTTGPAGPTGPQGSAATVAVGTTTTLAAGASATVTNAGTSSAAVFNFGIPQGAAGTGGGSGSLPGFVLGMKNGLWSLVGPQEYAGPNSVTQNEVFALPVVFPRATTVTGLGCRIWTKGSAGAVCRLGLYSASGDVPGSLLYDSGAIDASTTAASNGITTTGMSQAVTAGLYYVAFVTQGAPTTNPSWLQVQGTVVVPGMVTSDITQTNLYPYAMTGVSGALPSTWGALASADSKAVRIYVQTTG